MLRPSRWARQRSGVDGGGGNRLPSTDQPPQASGGAAVAETPRDIRSDPPDAALTTDSTVVTAPSSGSTDTDEPATPASHQWHGPSVATIAVALAALGALVAGVACWYAFLRPTDFTADALVAVLPDDPAAPDSSVDIAAVWVEVGNAPALVHTVATGLGESDSAVADAVVITQPTGVPLLSITATTADAATSAAMANAFASQLVQQDQQGQVGHYHLQQVSEARPPAEHDSSVGTAGLAGAALLGGAVGGLAGRSIARRRAQGPDARWHPAS
jgi:hypothetical protein